MHVPAAQDSLYASEVSLKKLKVCILEINRLPQNSIVDFFKKILKKEVIYQNPTPSLISDISCKQDHWGNRYSCTACKSLNLTIILFGLFTLIVLLCTYNAGGVTNGQSSGSARNTSHTT